MDDDDDDDDVDDDDDDEGTVKNTFSLTHFFFTCVCFRRTIWKMEIFMMMIMK